MQIPIKGVIVSNDYKEVYDWYGMEAVSPMDVASLLPEDGSPIEVLINSPGGMVDAGSEIYTALKSYSGEVTTKIVGAAASAASFISLAGDRILMSPTGYFMIHNAMNGTYGNQHDLRQTANQVENISSGMAQLYANRTGKTIEEIQELMNNETFFNAQQAKEMGFIDEIMFESAPVVTNAIDSVILPQAVIEKARATMKTQVGSLAVKTEVELTDDQINLIADKVISNLENKLNKQTNEPTPKAKNRRFIF